MSETPTGSNEGLALAVDDIKHAVQDAIRQLDLHEKEQKARDDAKAAAKERLTNRVSVAAICLTMLMSFLNFARAGLEGMAQDAKGDSARAKADANANWDFYQARLAERSSFVVADDALQREVTQLADGDPRVRLAGVQHAEYVSRIATIDRQAQQVSFVATDLQRRQILRRRDGERLDRRVTGYDTGTRVLTLAVVLLSITLLAQRGFLFWISVATAMTGAAIAINGYFLLR